jgi:hypothetical protein
MTGWAVSASSSALVPVTRAEPHLTQNDKEYYFLEERLLSAFPLRETSPHEPSDGPCGLAIFAENRFYLTEPL